MNIERFEIINLGNHANGEALGCETNNLGVGILYHDRFAVLKGEEVIYFEIEGGRLMGKTDEKFFILGSKKAYVISPDGTKEVDLQQLSVCSFCLKEQFLIQINPLFGTLTIKDLNGMENNVVIKTSSSQIKAYEICQLIFCKKGKLFLTDQSGKEIELGSDQDLSFPLTDSKNTIADRDVVITLRPRGLMVQHKGRKLGLKSVKKIGRCFLMEEIDGLALTLNINSKESILFLTPNIMFVVGFDRIRDILKNNGISISKDIREAIKFVKVINGKIIMFVDHSVVSITGETGIYIEEKEIEEQFVFSGQHGKVSRNAFLFPASKTVLVV